MCCGRIVKISDFFCDGVSNGYLIDFLRGLEFLLFCKHFFSGVM